MIAEDMLLELYNEATQGSLPLNEWEITFINDVYEVVYENEWEMTISQEEKVEEIYDKYLG